MKSRVKTLHSLFRDALGAISIEELVSNFEISKVSTEIEEMFHLIERGNRWNN